MRGRRMARPGGASELCILGLLDGVDQLEICFWSRRRIGYRIQSLCSRKPSPRLRQNEELNVVGSPCMRMNDIVTSSFSFMGTCCFIK